MNRSLQSTCPGIYPLKRRRTGPPDTLSQRNLLKGDTSEDTSWSENVDSVHIFTFASLAWLFYQYIRCLCIFIDLFIFEQFATFFLHLSVHSLTPSSCSPRFTVSWPPSRRFAVYSLPGNRGLAFNGSQFVAFVLHWVVYSLPPSYLYSVVYSLPPSSSFQRFTVATFLHSAVYSLS